MNPNTDFIPFSRPSLGTEEEEAVIKVLRSGWLTSGEAVIAFEKEFAEYIQAGHAVAVNSATAGLHLAYEALGLKENCSILTSPYTFTATAEAARYLKADVIFADIDYDTLNISPEKAEMQLAGFTGKKALLVPVHMAGLPCRMEELTYLAEKYRTSMVEDCAHAFPVKHNGRYAGSFGHCGVFSFYANKTITTGEGGMIMTEDKKTADRMRLMRLHGIDRTVWDRYTKASSGWFYDVTEAGFKYNLTDIAAAIGREQLKKAEAFKQKRKALAAGYLKAFNDLDFIKNPADGPDHAWHLFILRLVPEKLSINRDIFIEELKARGIGCSVHYTPLHLLSYYKKLYNFRPEDFPAALKASQEVLSLPLYPDMQEEQLHRVIDAVIETGKKFRRKSV
jgi:dTDP-4-amino-4,6-dideoxygalactose transaminase